MTLILKKPTGANLVLRKELPADAQADAYIAAVEAADGQALEPGVKFAIKNFVLCCKQDGIWNAIKASCILAGARTLNGALVPLVGTAPTNFNFVSGDYNRKTGLVGDGSTKYLNSNRNNNADPQNSKHIAIFLGQSTPYANVRAAIGTGVVSGGSWVLYNTMTLFLRNNAATSVQISVPGDSIASNLIALSRSDSANMTYRIQGQNTLTSSASVIPSNQNILIFNGPGSLSSARLAFYSIGESLDLALLDARVTDLINAIGAAIP